MVYIVLEATSDISDRLEMRQIGLITYLSCRSDEFGGHCHGLISEYGDHTGSVTSAWANIICCISGSDQ